MASEDDTDHLDLADGDEPADGEPISYQTFGEQFIRHLVTVPRLRAEVEQILQATMEGSAEALAAALDRVLAGYSRDGFDVEMERFGQCFTTNDFKEGTTAFLEKRKPQFPGS